MKANNIFKFIFIILVLIFFFMIIAGRSGYYEYELSEKRRLTDEAIERFEKDVSEGKNIDIKNYLDSKNKNYNNKVSNMGNDISNTIEKIISKGFRSLFKYLNKQIDK